MTFRQELQALDPVVVDAAIERISNGLNTLSCVALIRAQGNFWQYDMESCPYVTAYALNTWALGIKPLWWNSPKDFSFERVLALEEFKDAIIEAKKLTIFERIKTWLLSPCEYANFT